MVAPATPPAASPETPQVEETPLPVQRLVIFAPHIAPNDGHRAWVQGWYRQVDVRKRKTSPAQYRGHVAVELADGRRVFLEPPNDAAALREADEISTWEGKVVDVLGVVNSTCPHDGQTASIISPCLTAVETVRAHTPTQIFLPNGKSVEECSQYTEEAQACIGQGFVYNRYASPHCGGARPDPRLLAERQSAEMAECRCFSPGQLQERKLACSRMP